jgi:rare lipoprotein A
MTFLIILLALLFGSACGHPKQARVNVPPAPNTEASTAAAPTATKEAPGASPSSSRSLPSTGAASPREGGSSLAEPVVPADARPLATEIGRASWYGPPYHHRVGSNGQVYDMHAMTAAHRTLPLGSVVRVTNLKTGHTALVRITDRGPFISGRVLDLSLAAARKVDVYGPGVAEVKVEVVTAPAPLDTGGKWAVQIGGFPHERAAAELADALTRRYRSAKVVRFSSPGGDWWLRVRVLADDRARAQELVSQTKTPEGAVFLVRLD